VKLFLIDTELKHGDHCQQETDEDCAACCQLTDEETPSRRLFVSKMMMYHSLRCKLLTECIVLDGHTERITSIFYRSGVIMTGQPIH
jgi:hypothetical protein